MRVSQDGTSYADVPDWRDSALCAKHRDPELWHRRDEDDIQEAKRICRLCPVRTQCFIDALADPDQPGVWAGMTREERRQAIRAAAYNARRAS